MSTEVLGTAYGTDVEAGGLRSTLSRNALKLQSDERLVELSRTGCDRAFETIDQRYRPQLVRYCTPMLGEDRAQDVAQQTLTQAYMTLRSDDRPIKLRYWLLRVAHNFSIDALRKKGSAYEQLDENYDGVAQPPALLEQRQKFGSVLKQIDTLPERQRTALLLREFEGRSYDEIASELGATPAIVSQLLQRARTRLRDGLGLLVPIPLLRMLASPPGTGGHRIAEITSSAAASSPGLIQATAVALVAGAMTFGGAAAMEQSQAAGTRGAGNGVEVASTTGSDRLEPGSGATALGDSGLSDRGPTVAPGQNGSTGDHHGSRGPVGQRPDATSSSHAKDHPLSPERTLRNNSVPHQTAAVPLTGRALHDYNRDQRDAKKIQDKIEKRIRKHAKQERQRTTAGEKLERKDAKHERQQAHDEQRSTSQAERNAIRQESRQKKSEANQQQSLAKQQQQQAKQQQKQAAQQQKQAAQQQKQAAQQQQQAAKQQQQAAKAPKKAPKQQATTVAP